MAKSKAHKIEDLFNRFKTLNDREKAELLDRLWHRNDTFSDAGSPQQIAVATDFFEWVAKKLPDPAPISSIDELLNMGNKIHGADLGDEDAKNSLKAISNGK